MFAADATAPAFLPSGQDPVRRVVRVLNVALRHRWLFIILPLLAGAISVVISVRRPRTYTTTATFMSQSATANRAPAAGLAAQFGISLGNSDPTLSPDFYADLLRSRPIVEATARSEYLIPDGDTVVRRTLVQHFGDADRAIDRVSGGISTGIRPKTGVVVLSVRAESRELAQQIAAALLAQLDEFNQGRRKSRVGAERQFTQARLSEAQTELRAAEDQLQEFYTRNRDFERSPELRFREERLMREVVRRQNVYASLAQAFEQAKIDEVRDTPVITVLEEPQLPRIADSRHTIDRGLLALALGLLAAMMLAAARESMKKSRNESMDELVEMKALGRQFLFELRNPIRAARKAVS